MDQNIKDGNLSEFGKIFQRGTRYIGGINENFDIRDMDKTAGITKLPESDIVRDISVYKCLKERRSVRGYSGARICAADLSWVLWAAQGISDVRGDRCFRTSPSAGALYPVDTYVAVFDVEGIDRGVAKYIDDQHVLQWRYRTDCDLRAKFYDACLQQDMILNSAVMFIWVADFNRCVWRYSQRAYRYVYLEAGHIAQNLFLAVAGLGFGACAVGAYFDDQMDTLCGLDGDCRTVIYCATAGKISEKGE